MPTINNFEDLEIWKTTREVTKEVYSDFRSNKDFGFRDQIQRCAVSIMNNIAEGFSRESKKERVYFLNIAKGSSGELKSMYYIAEDLEYLNAESALERRIKIQGLSNGIASFKKYLKTSR
jgi:four helix bundle protein